MNNMKKLEEGRIKLYEAIEKSGLEYEKIIGVDTTLHEEIIIMQKEIFESFMIK